MAIADIAAVWTPAIWIKNTREKVGTYPSILNSGIAVETPQFNEIASGAGLTANIPFFKDTTDQVDAIQVEDTAPTFQALTTGLQVAPILNRVSANQSSALAAQVSGGDIVGEFTTALAMKRAKQRNATLINIVRGAFNSLGASGAAAPLLANRIDSFDETGVGASAAQTFSSTLFITAKALMGELADDLRGGALLVHPNVLAALEIEDAVSFQTGNKSDLPFAFRTYRGVPVFTSERLVRAGTTDGFVYDSYLFGKGVVAKGEKPQVGGTPANPAIDVASMNYVPDALKNNDQIIDRSRFLMHLNGMKWVGTAAGQSATDTELRTAANWNLVYSDAKRTGIVCIRTNL